MKTYLLVLVFLFSISINAQLIPKDTIYFKYDAKYIKTYAELPERLYIKDGSGTNSGSFFFTRITNIGVPKSKPKVMCLRNYVRSSKFYDKKKQLNLNDYGLYEELNKFIIVFVKKNRDLKQYILTESSFEIQ